MPAAIRTRLPPRSISRRRCALPRRLSLDFRDLFQEGFAFDSIDGDVTGDTTFTIDGSGTCVGADCGSDEAGSYTVTGTDGDTVFRCRKGDAGDLAATIKRALAGAELRAAVGEAGRRRVIERWTWQRCAELTVEQYREVLAMPQNLAKLRRNGRI